MQHREVLVDVVTGRHGERVPEVVRVVALVVVAHARVLADHRGGFVDAVGVDLRGDERGLVAERARVEDRRELPEHARGLRGAQPFHHVGLGDPEPLAQCGERRGDQGEVPLDRIEQLFVEILELCHCSHGRAHGPGRSHSLRSPLRDAGWRTIRAPCPCRRLAARGRARTDGLRCQETVVDVVDCVGMLASLIDSETLLRSRATTTSMCWPGQWPRAAAMRSFMSPIG